MAPYESPLSVVIKGALAGVVGTAARTVGMRQAPTVMGRLGLGEPRGGEGRGGAGGEQPLEEPTAKLAEKVAVGVLETPVEPETKQVAGQAIHWAYGAAWGAYYGIMQASLRLPDLVHGMLFGGLVASTLVPAMRLTPPPTRQPMGMTMLQTVLHLVYGWTTALAFKRLSPGR